MIDMTDEISANMRIAFTPDELRVTGVSPHRSPFQIVLTILLALYAFIQSARAVSTLYDAFSSFWQSGHSFRDILPETLEALAFLAFTGWVIFQWIRPALTETLLCTRQTLELTRSRSGKLISQNSYAIPDIFSLRYGVIRQTGDSAVSGLLFSLKGEHPKATPHNALAGLKSVEAAKILRELQRLGIPVIHDPAERMLVEMEQSRRKFLGGIFSN